jgi:hypothetical protein
MLVSASPALGPDEDGRYFTVFIPIGEILKLRHVDTPLVGHPWLDVPSDEIIGLSISRADHRTIGRHLEAGRFIAIRAVARRGKKARGCRMDSQGQPLVDYHFGWRLRDKYIADPVDRKWLEQFSQESARYAEMVFLIEAIAGYFRRLSDNLAMAPKPPRVKRKKLRAKDRGKNYA